MLSLQCYDFIKYPLIGYLDVVSVYLRLAQIKNKTRKQFGPIWLTRDLLAGELRRFANFLILSRSKIQLSA